LWLSAESTSREPGANANPSPTSRSAALAFAVKTTSYSAGSAEKKSSVPRRASSMISVLRSDATLCECGFPSTASARNSR
jgi:hypothetical protein